MFESIEMLRMARAMGQHTQSRHIQVARNIANADRPDYKATDLQPFAETYRQGEHSGALRVTNPKHMNSPQWAPGIARAVPIEGQSSPNGNSVSLEDQMVRAAEVKRNHDLSLTIYRSGLDLMRTSLGRR